MLLCLVRVAVANQIVKAGIAGIDQGARVVAVQKGDFSGTDFQRTETVVARLPRGLDRGLQLRPVAVGVAENEMRRPGANISTISAEPISPQCSTSCTSRLSSIRTAWRA